MKKGNLLITIGLLLIAAALLLTVYNQWENYMAGKRANEALKELRTYISSKESQYMSEDQESENENTIESGEDYPDYLLNPEMDMPVEVINGNYYIGVLSIPALERELPIIEQWDYSKLKIAPCRYSGSAYLDNMVICAHNFIIQFASIGNLKYGDEVIFTDVDGNVFRYIVSEIITLQPTAIEQMKTGDWDLTLFTCTMSGNARITVRCERQKTGN